MLAPDATATPVGFSDVLIENLSNTPDYLSCQDGIGTGHSLVAKTLAVLSVDTVVPVNGSLIVSLVAVETGLAPTAEFMRFQTCPVIL